MVSQFEVNYKQQIVKILEDRRFILIYLIDTYVAYLDII